MCKVTGFGFAEHVLDREEYERAKGVLCCHCVHHKMHLPSAFSPHLNIFVLVQVLQEVRWMAPEKLRYNDHTRMSDVWAFGVLMWEIYNHGDLDFKFAVIIILTLYWEDITLSWHCSSSVWSCCGVVIKQ